MPAGDRDINQVGAFFCSRPVRPQDQRLTRPLSFPVKQPVRNFRKTVCEFWIKGQCIKGDSCGFLHELDPERMPVCKTFKKLGVCNDPGECALPAASSPRQGSGPWQTSSQTVRSSTP